ncbi:MAG TPA: ATP-binding protein [Pirellulaceae bacterium]|nr:ATP-binding protein [Pirellulaceae bacterium]
MNDRIARELDHQWSKVWDLAIPSDPFIGTEFIKNVLDELELLNWPDRDRFAIHMSLEEAIMNAIKHGNCQQTDKQVLIDARISAAKFYIRVTDEGPGFNPHDVPDPTLEENLTKTSGRGLKLMRIYMNFVVYNSVGNQVELLKIRQD